MSSDCDGADEAPTEVNAANSWPPRMRTEQVASYLDPRARASRRGEDLAQLARGRARPVLPLPWARCCSMNKSELDRWGEHDALKTEGPMRRNRRAASEQQAAA